jgi:hypothetical protein
MLPYKTFLYFLLDTPTGKVYYRDNGTLKIQIITADSDVSLKNAPLNWLDTELSFARNSTYHGINRSYSTPQEFVKDAVVMIKELFLLGVGTEVPLTLAVFKYNSQPLTGEPQYKLYFKANLDLPEINETVLETLTVNLMEGGVTQLLKSYEGTTLQIPCDGSIQENQKVNLDGLLVPDVFYYQTVPLKDLTEVKPLWISISPLPLTFVNNEGDNYGIIHNDQTLEVITYDGSIDPNQIITYSATSPNYLFLSVSKITLSIKGSLPLRYNNPAQVQLFLSTSQGQLIPVSDNYFSDSHRIITFSIDTQITLDENEALFLFIQIRNPSGDITLSRNLIDVLNGSFSLSFVSQAKPTRAWAISAADLFKLMVKEICLLASTTNQTFNYSAVSSLLAANLNIMFTSGDALRASGDSSYQRFFSLTQNNNILQTSFGPVIKLTLKDFYQAIETILVAELNAGHNGVTETLEIEDLESIYDSSVVDFSIGEMASLKWNFAKDLAFSDLEIGYPPQTYDQKAGKYEYNTTLEMKAPINSFSKKLSKISKIRFDSYGIERLRSNVGAPTSTTRNDSDNGVFGLNVDLNQTIFDYYSAGFTSQIPDPGNPLNTNINFQQNVSCQQIPATSFDGEYFQPNTDNAIVMFSVPGYIVNETCNLTVSGLINSVNKPPLAPDDSFTLKLWHNGQVIYTYTVGVSGVNTPISINYDFTQFFAYKDWVYITMETTATGEATINTASLNIGTYIIMNAANIPVLSGSFKLLSWLSFSPDSKPYVETSHVQYGFQYFVFNSLVPNTNFLLQSFFNSWISNQVADFSVDCHINDLVQSSVVTGSVDGLPLVNSISLPRDYALNDIVFFSANVLGSVLNVSMTSLDVTFYSTQIKCYSLKRVQYDSLSGVPNIAKNDAGEIRTDISGAPYNIEDLTPKTLYRKWRNYIMSTFMDQVTGLMKFQTLSKNSYLSRSINGEVITENSDEQVLGFKRLFYPIELQVKANVPLGFAELMNKTKNAHIHGTFMGTDIYFFADSLNQKAALNESQTWKAILSPKTDLTAFARITSFKIPAMEDNQISYAFSNAIQLVPYNQTLPDKYHTRNRDTFLFKDQIGNWVNQDDYGQPVQIGDPLPFQFITNGLSNITYTVYNCDGIYLGPTALDVAISPAVSDPYALWQKIIDTTGWARDNYYIVISAAGSPVYRSEPLWLRNKIELEGSVLLEATNTFNTQGIVFDAGFVISMRFKGGYDNKFKQKYLGKFYIDQPQDITVLNAIPYETSTLLIGRDGGVPDYVPKKILRMLLMDGCMLDGEGFSLNDGAELEEVFTKGAPKKFQKVEIRPSKNKPGISTLPSGVSSDDSSMIVTVNPQSFGPNVTNSSGTTETDLISIIVE